MNEIATAKLEMVGLTREDGDKFPSELSGGMTKRVALARALALDPAIVFLDEPTSGLDPIAAGDFDDLIRTLQETLGLTVFMVTHDLASLNTVCDRVAALADGKIVAIGSMAELLRSDHPWVKAYFHGKRSLCCNQNRAETMETRAPFIVVGAFVLVAIGAVFGFVYWLHNTAGTGARTVHHIQFDGSVSGLLVGAAVLFNGIRVGEVTNLGLAAGNPRQVDATIAVTSGTPVHVDTKVGLDFQGLTGVPVIALEGGKEVGASTDTQTLIADPAAGQSITQAARNALARVDSVLADNAEPLKSTIANLKIFTEGLAKNTGGLDSRGRPRQDDGRWRGDDPQDDLRPQHSLGLCIAQKAA